MNIMDKQRDHLAVSLIHITVFIIINITTARLSTPPLSP